MTLAPKRNPCSIRLVEMVFNLQWKGRNIGEMSIPEIRQQLKDGGISRMHLVSTEDGWMAVDEFLSRVDLANEQERQQLAAQRRLERQNIATEYPADLPSSNPYDNSRSDSQSGHRPPSLPIYSVPSPYPHEASFPHYPDGSAVNLGGDGDSQEARPPLFAFFANLTWSNRAAFWILIVGAAPFLVSLVFEYSRTEVRWVIWMLQAYFSILLAGFFYMLSGSGPLVLKKGVGFFFFTVLVGTPLLFAAQEWPALKQILAATESSKLSSGLWGYIAGVGVLEELCKALPLLFFCLGKRGLDTRSTVFLGLMSGLGFAFSEGGLYTVAAAINAVGTDITSTIETLQQSVSEEQFIKKLEHLQPDLLRLHLLGVNRHLVRMISLPILHGAWTGWVAWFVVRATSGRAWLNIVTGILLAATVHGVYDVIAAGYLDAGAGRDFLILLIAALTILMFASLLLVRSSTPLNERENT